MSSFITREKDKGRSQSHVVPNPINNGVNLTAEEQLAVWEGRGTRTQRVGDKNGGGRGSLPFPKELEEGEELELDLPPHIIQFDKLIKAVDKYEDIVRKGISGVAEMMGAEAFPPGQFERIMSKMDRGTKILDKMMGYEKFGETSKLFLYSANTSPKRRMAMLPIPVLEQEMFTSSIHKLSESIDKIYTFLKERDNQEDLEDGQHFLKNRMDKFDELIEILDKELDETGRELNEVEKYTSMMTELMQGHEEEDTSEEEEFVHTKDPPK